jgi:CheY-like chemotaxis protein
MRRQPLNIVLIEDDDLEAETVSRSLEKVQIPYQIAVFNNAADALHELHEQKKYLERALPFLVLLDLKMPRMNGLEFLDHVRQDPILRAAIVFVLSISDEDEDKAAAYDRQVAGYFVKSRLGPGYAQLADLLHAYWQVVEVPHN